MISIQCTNLNVPTHLKVNGIFQLSVLLLLYHANAVVEELGGETDIDDVDERDVLTWFSYIAIISDADCDPILFRTTASCVTLSCSTTFDRLSTCDFKLLIWLQNNVPYKHKAALGKTKKIKLHNQWLLLDPGRGWILVLNHSNIRTLTSQRVERWDGKMAYSVVYWIRVESKKIQAHWNTCKIII